MKLTTPILVEKTDVSISHSDKIMLLGSCFTQNIGKQLGTLKFDTLVNPFGIIYNPASINFLLQRIIHLEKFTPKDILQKNEQYFSFENHSSLNSTNELVHLNKINNLLTATHHFLKTSRLLIFTFGTAFVYQYKNNSKIVANCHKLPNSVFEKKRLSVGNIFANYNESLKQLFEFNKNVKVIFTVSPVRHIKDGIVNNTKSKAILHLAIEQLVNSHFEKCTYFPAYEIVMDELRDYRFYKNDLLHPTELAIQYIWEQFMSAYCNQTTVKLNEQITSLLQQYNHKPFNANSQQHKNGLQSLLKKMQQFQTENNISFIKEIEQLKKNINFAE